MKSPIRNIAQVRAEAQNEVCLHDRAFKRERYVSGQSKQELDKQEEPPYRLYNPS